jgi:hypothetical protein
MEGPSRPAQAFIMVDPLQAPRHLGTLLCMNVALSSTKISVKGARAVRSDALGRLEALLPVKLRRRLSGATPDDKELKANANAAVVNAYKAAADSGSVPGAIMVQGYFHRGSKRRPSTTSLQELLTEASDGHTWAAVAADHMAHPDPAILYDTEVYEALETPEGGAGAAAPHHGHGRHWVAARLGVKGSDALRFMAVSYHGAGHQQRGENTKPQLQPQAQCKIGKAGARVSDASVEFVKIGTDPAPAELTRSPSGKRNKGGKRLSAAPTHQEQTDLLQLTSVKLSDFSTPAIVAGDWGCEPAAAVKAVSVAGVTLRLSTPEEPLPHTSCRLGKPMTDAAVVINHDAAGDAGAEATGCKAAAIQTTALPHPPRIQIMGFEHDAVLLRFSLTQVAA